MMTGRQSISLRSQIRLARLEYAVMRFESAAAIALIIIATSATYLLGDIELVPDGAWIAVLLFGLAAEAVLVLSSVFDPGSGAKHIGATMAEIFGVVGIRDPAISNEVARAIEYRTRIEDVLGGKQRALRQTMADTVAGVDSWLTGIGRLAKRLDRFRDEANFQSAGKFQLRERIDDLECRAQEASDRKVQSQLRETIASRRHQLRMIEELENVMERGELRLEHAVGALGTIYTQVTIFAARGIDEAEATRLAREISEEIDQVDAVLAAMDQIAEPLEVV